MPGRRDVGISLWRPDLTIELATGSPANRERVLKESKADIIVAVGRGIKSKDNLALAEKLAEVLGDNSLMSLDARMWNEDIELADLQVQAGNDELEKVNAANNLSTSKLTLMQLMNLI